MTSLAPIRLCECVVWYHSDGSYEGCTQLHSELFVVMGSCESDIISDCMMSGCVQ